MVWTSGPQGQLAPSLVALYDEVDEAHPNRSTASDGTIGDAAHAGRTSDHNPALYKGKRYVTAADVTDWDPRFDADAFLERLRTGRDRRIKYAISDGRFFSSYASGSREAWEWAPYSGPNGHFLHIHISVLLTDVGLFDTRSWHVAPDTPPTTPPPITEDRSNMPLIIRCKGEPSRLLDGGIFVPLDDASLYALGAAKLPQAEVTKQDYDEIRDQALDIMGRPKT
jgi:hypothetical protein